MALLLLFRLMTVVVLLLAAVLSPARHARAQESGFSLYTTPALIPTFDPAISDYVVRAADSQRVQVSVNLPSGEFASVDGQAPLAHSFVATVKVSAGQSFTVVLAVPGSPSRTYTLRCLPADFPQWTAERPGSPQAEWYVTSPDLSFISTVSQPYAVVFDNWGIPMWWFRADLGPFDAKLLPNGDLAWTDNDGVKEYGLDGTLKHSLMPVNAGMDIHELQLLPNGDTLIIANQPKGPVDLTAYAGPTAASVFDNNVQELSPSGELVWRWSTYDHIAVSETDANLWQSFLQQDPADPYHMNSVEPDGEGYVISFRHLNSVIKIDKATGNILWTLGGLKRPESLRFVDDPYGNFGGQHDARLLPDGTLTLHDNGSGRNRPPRAVRYRLDLAARTATLIEQVTDPDAPFSLCCGDARMLPGGNWVMSWGAEPSVTELTASGERVFRLNFGDFFAYRVTPVSHGVLSRDALRAGMDAQNPRPTQSVDTDCLPGDVSGDRKVDVADVVLALKDLVGITALDSAQTHAADANLDGQLSVADVIVILKALTQLDSLPAACR